MSNQRFVNEIYRTEERTKALALLIQQSIYGYYDSMFDDLSDVDDDDETEYFAVLGTYLSLKAFKDVIKFSGNIINLYKNELKEIRPRFGVNEEDAILTKEIALNHQNLIISKLMTSITAVSVAMSAAKISKSEMPKRRDLREQYIDPVLTNVETDLVTNVSGYRSAIEIRKASELEANPRFEYIGAIDKLNRPFCKYVLAKSKYWTEKEIKELDSHPDAQLLPVKVFCGGYNCRHRWIYTDRK